MNHRIRRRKKSSGYERWLDKWAWTPNTTESEVEESFFKDPP